MVFGLAEDFVTNGGGVFSSVGLPEDKEGFFWGDAKFVKAAVGVLVEL